ncbi:MAG TPA: DUF4276 family protein [bacterium]|nr:DUF4276 family protein [bacterium]HQO34587.1 DUF4276 family protein [bacterium]HQQ00158.1 DUF4276 family protein [bacterium]
MKFILFVEGETERTALPTFLKRWLDPRLNRCVGIDPVKFDGCKALIRKSPLKAGIYLKQSDVIAVIGLLDLYGPDFPDDKKDAESRYQWAKADLERRVDHERFRQFFAVHEIEAWLLSDPSIFPLAVQNVLKKEHRQPEEVNFHKPPARLLDGIYEIWRRKRYIKPVDGKGLFSKLDPGLVYTKCPKFKEMMDEMLNLAKAAGL